MRLKDTFILAHVWFIKIALIIHVVNCYTVPTPTLEVLRPSGFRVSIPDEPGIALFGFHGNLNKRLIGAEPGDFNVEITVPTNNLWVYENKTTFLQPGDIINYWIHVQHRSRAYRVFNKSLTVPQSSMSLPVWNSTISSPDVSQNEYESESQSTNKYCILSKTIINGGHTTCKGQLIFEDQFDTLNWQKWKKDIRIPLDSQDAEFVSYQNRPENCYIKDGNLYIVPTLLTEIPNYNEDQLRNGILDLGTECTATTDLSRECRRQAMGYVILPPIVSARINTKDSFSFLYGRIEIRARLPRGDWLFPQILLESKNDYYGKKAYVSGQMRIAFIRGNEILETKNGDQIDGHRLYGGLVFTTGETYRDSWLKSTLKSGHLGRSFHTYSLTWTDESITLAVDGKEYGVWSGRFSNLFKSYNISYPPLWDEGEFMAPFDKEFYITLGVSAGGVSDFPDGCRTGIDKNSKPWNNTDPKCELNFWKNKQSWYRTWEGQEAGLEIDYIKVWAL